MKKNYQIFISLVLLCVLIIFGLIWINTSLTAKFPNEKEFLPTWASLRTFIDYGIDPYSEQASNRTQFLFYKEVIQDNSDPLKLDQALPPLLVFFPLAFINEYSIARIIYLISLDLFLISIPIVLMNLLDWKPPLLLMISFIILVILGPIFIQALITHGPIIFVVSMILIGLLCLKFNLDEFAGVVFALVIFQPSLTALFLVFIGLWIVRNLRWRVIWGFLMTFSLLVLISLALVPNWIIGFIKAFRIEEVYRNYLSTSLILSEFSLGIGPKLALLLTGSVSILLLYEWLTLKKGEFHWFLWTNSLTICSFSLIGLKVLPNSSLILIIPFMYLISVASQRMTGKYKWTIQLSFLFLVFILGWGVFIYLIDQNMIGTLNLVLNIISPIFLITGLYWVRWWVIKYQRLQAVAK